MTTPTARTTGTASDMRTTSTTRRGVSIEETKPSFKTTELLFYVLAIVGVLIAAKVEVGFEADQAWLYITVLTVGYMISRGIAKAGTHARDNDPRTEAYPDNR